MKNKNIYRSLLALSSLMLVSSCEKEYVPVDTLSDVAYYTSQSALQGDNCLFNVGDYISLMDASQGLLSHKWIIEDGARFCIDDFDCKVEPFLDQIDPNKGLESENLVESVCFTKPFTGKITLYNTFAEKVVTHGTNVVEAVEKDGAWVLEKVINVTVYGPIEPAFKVSAKGQELVVNAGDKVDVNKPTSIEVSIGDLITFEDLTTYEVEGTRTWDVPGSGQLTSSAASAQFSFNELGEFSGFSIKTSREKPQSSTVKQIPLVVKVVPSTEDFRINTDQMKITTEASNRIVLTANGAFKPVGDVAANFAVTVAKGDGTAVGGVSVDKVSVNPNNSGELFLELNDYVYPGEVVTLVYDGAGAIESTDNRTLFDFAAAAVLNENKGFNAFDIDMYSFEGGTAFTPMGWYAFPTAAPNLIFSITDRPEPTDDNLQAALIDATALTEITAGPIYIQNALATNTTPVAAGNYLLTYKLYLTEDSMSGMRYDVYFNTTKVGSNFKIINDTTWVFPSETNKWLEFSLPVTIDADSDCAVKLQIPKPNVTAGKSKFYIDDFQLIKVR